MSIVISRLSIIAFAFVIFQTSCLLAADVNVKMNDDWSFSKGPEYPGAAGSLKPGQDGKPMVLTYDFSGGGSYVAASKKLDPSGDLTGVEVTAAGPGGSFGVVLVDDTGQNFVFRQGRLEAGEQTLDVDLGAPSTSYGGADDKTLHFPIKSIRLMVEKNKAMPTGKVTISKVILRSK